MQSSPAIRRDRLTKNLFIYQNPEQFCFGTDAVLLSWFCRRKKAERPIDLCTGNGVIPLLLSEGNYPEIYGVEIQPSQAALADRSVRENELCGRVKILCGDIRQIGNLENKTLFPLRQGGFDLVSANPPYAAAGHGKQAEGDRGIARTDSECSLRDLLRAANFLLRHGGRFCMIHRAERLTDAICLMREAKIEPKVLLPVITKPGKGVSLVLIEGKKGAQRNLTLQEPLLIQNSDGSYTETVREIYKDFKK